MENNQGNLSGDNSANPFKPMVPLFVFCAILIVFSVCAGISIPIIGLLVIYSKGL